MKHRENTDIASQKNAENTKNVENSAKIGMHSAFQNIVFSWITPEYIESKRGAMWYICAGTVSVLLVVYAYFSDAWTMALVFSILPVIYILKHRSETKFVEVKISTYGVQFGDIYVPFANMKYFWILHYSEHVNELHILTTNKIHPELTIHLMDQHADIIGKFLSLRVREAEGKKPALLDLLVRLLKLN